MYQFTDPSFIANTPWTFLWLVPAFHTSMTILSSKISPRWPRFGCEGYSRYTRAFLTVNSIKSRREIFEPKAFPRENINGESWTICCHSHFNCILFSLHSLIFLLQSYQWKMNLDQASARVISFSSIPTPANYPASC